MKKINSWKLIAVFGGLVVLFAALRIFRSPSLEGNLPTRLTDIDSTQVTELIITPAKDRSGEVRIVKSGGWKLKKGNQMLRPEQGVGINALRMLNGLKPDRLVSKKKSKWNDFQVGDSTGTHVMVMAGQSVMANLWIGRSDFAQSAGQQYGGKSLTYIRLDGEDEVFVVEGFLDAQFNRRLDDWRDKSFTRIKRDSVEKISFRYPADSSFVIEKIMGKWMVANQRADSMAVVSYLSSLEYINMGAFVESPPSANAEMVITLGKGSRTLGLIEIWAQAGRWTVRSSHQPDTFFATEPEAMKDISVGKGKFLPK